MVLTTLMYPAAPVGIAIPRGINPNWRRNRRSGIWCGSTDRAPKLRIKLPNSDFTSRGLPRGSDEVAMAPVPGKVVRHHEGAAVIFDQGTALNFGQVHRAYAFAGYIKVVDTILKVDNHIGDGRKNIDMAIAPVEFEDIGVAPATQKVVAGASDQEGAARTAVQLIDVPTTENGVVAAKSKQPVDAIIAFDKVVD